MEEFPHDLYLTLSTQCVRQTDGQNLYASITLCIAYGRATITFPRYIGVRTGLWGGETMSTIGLAVLTQYRHVTDWWTEKQTSRDYTALPRLCRCVAR